MAATVFFFMKEQIIPNLKEFVSWHNYSNWSQKYISRFGIWFFNHIMFENAGILLIEPLGTNFSENLIGIQIFSFTKMRMKMSSVKWRPFCLGLNVLTHYFRWLNAKEANPQCTEAASLVSFALSHPFVICHQLNITLYCASITTAHAFPFRVASMPVVRYDLSGGLPKCLWLFIYQDYSGICISKKLM